MVRKGNGGDVGAIGDMHARNAPAPWSVDGLLVTAQWNEKRWPVDLRLALSEYTAPMIRTLGREGLDNLKVELKKAHYGPRDKVTDAALDKLRAGSILHYGCVQKKQMDEEFGANDREGKPEAADMLPSDPAKLIKGIVNSTRYIRGLEIPGRSWFLH